MRGVTEPLLYFGHNETGQVICSSEDLEQERDILLRIYKMGMKKLNEKIINIINGKINEIQFYLT